MRAGGHVLIFGVAVGLHGLSGGLGLHAGQLRHHQPLCVLERSAEDLPDLARHVPGALSGDEAGHQLATDLRFQRFLMRPEPLRPGSVVEGRVDDGGGFRGRILHSFAEDPGLPFVLRHGALRQLPVDDPRHFLETVHECHAHFGFQHFQTIHFHRQVIERHLLVGLVGEITVHHVLLGLRRIGVDVHLADALPGFRQRDPILIRIPLIEGVDLRPTLPEHTEIDLLHLLADLLFVPDVLCLLAGFPASPVFAARKRIDLCLPPV